MTLAYPSSRGFAWRPAALAVVLSIAAMGLGQIATTPNLPWYYALQKPWFTPNWLFGPIWTALYLLMAYLFFRIARLASWARGRNPAIAAYVALLIVNAAWSFAFFAAHNPAYGLVDILAQVLLLATTVVLFNRLDGFAAAGFLPVALWVAYAGALNFEIWRMN